MVQTADRDSEDTSKDYDGDEETEDVEDEDKDEYTEDDEDDEDEAKSRELADARGFSFIFPTGRTYVTQTQSH
jgi:hypothetical protein